MARLSRKTTEMTARRYLTFSIRSLFILLTASAVWLGVVVYRAREQREAVKAIEAAGGVVVYDWQDAFDLFSPADPAPPGPAWLRRFIGDEHFQEVTSVSFYPTAPVEFNAVQVWIPHLKRFPKLKFMFVGAYTSKASRSLLDEALPNCKISALRGRYWIRRESNRRPASPP